MADPVSAAALFQTVGGAGATQAGMLAAQTAAFGAAGTGATLSALGAAGTGGLISGGATLFGGMGGMGGLMQGASLASSVFGNMSAGRQAEYAAQAQAQGVKAQAYQQGLKAEEESIMRRERLLKAMSQQGAYTGAAGVRGGSVDALRLESIDQYRREQQSADAMASLDQDMFGRDAVAITQRGKAEKRQSYMKGITSLLEIG